MDPVAYDRRERRDAGPAVQESAKNRGLSGAALWLLAIIAVAALAWFLRATFNVTAPLAFGVLLAVVLAPVQRAVARRVPRKLNWLGPLAAMLTLAGVVVGVGWFLGYSVSMVMEKAPSYSESYDKVQQWARQIGVTLPDLFPSSEATNESEGSGAEPGAAGAASVSQNALQSLGSAAWSALSRATGVVTLAVLIFFFTLLMLLEGGSWRKRIEGAWGSRSGDALDVVDSIITKIREYLWVRTVVGLLSGLLAGVWFLLIGLDFWYLWGFLFFALNYIPFVGSLLAGIPPTLLAFASGGWSMGLLAAGGTLVTENVMGNFIDPRLQGKRLSISPVVLLTALTFFGWAWSWPGLLLAVPITAAFVVTAAHIELLKPLALLLSNSESD